MDEDQKILTIISEHLGISKNELTLDSDLREDLNAQDIEIADLIMKLEKEFALHLSSDDVKNVKTIRDILDLIKIS